MNIYIYLSPDELAGGPGASPSKVANVYYRLERKKKLQNSLLRVA
jgi:hypothetical protein